MTLQKRRNSNQTCAKLKLSKEPQTVKNQTKNSNTAVQPRGDWLPSGSPPHVASHPQAKFSSNLTREECAYNKYQWPFNQRSSVSHDENRSTTSALCKKLKAEGGRQHSQTSWACTIQEQIRPALTPAALHHSAILISSPNSIPQQMQSWSQQVLEFCLIVCLRTNTPQNLQYSILGSNVTEDKCQLDFGHSNSLAPVSHCNYCSLHLEGLSHSIPAPRKTKHHRSIALDWDSESEPVNTVSS